MEQLFRLIALFTVLGVIITGCATNPLILKESDAYYKEGLSYLTNDPQRAFVAFQRAIQINPKNREAHYALGHIYFMQDRNDKAKEEFKTVLWINPGDSETHNYLGKVYEREGKWDEAVNEFRLALNNPLYSTPDIPHYNLGVVLFKKGDPEGSLRELTEAVKINPNHGYAHYEMGQVYLKLEKAKEAIGAYQSAIRLFPDYPEAHYNLAKAYMKDGMKPQAKAEFETVIKLAPGSEMASDSSRYIARIIK
ncbi:MAG: tetratricopeptide repeat protein [Nitrospirae bacterium]|nr:tetratricopeptide repeat protein [Nitrospirota bacterium]